MLGNLGYLSTSMMKLIMRIFNSGKQLTRGPILDVEGFLNPSL